MHIFIEDLLRIQEKNTDCNRVFQGSVDPFLIISNIPLEKHWSQIITFSRLWCILGFLSFQVFYQALDEPLIANYSVFEASLDTWFLSFQVSNEALKKSLIWIKWCRFVLSYFFTQELQIRPPNPLPSLADQI